MKARAGTGRRSEAAMQVRCYRCGWSITLSGEQVDFALQAARAEGGKHYNLRCTRCRMINKIPLKQLEQAAPRAGTADESSTAA
jgi:hypothetical protein